jgi:rare lipoprotein A
MYIKTIKNLLSLFAICAFPYVLFIFNETATAQPEKQVKIEIASEINSEKQSVVVSTSDSRSNVLKVGETRSRSIARSQAQDDAIAKIYSHKLEDRQAVTVYVRGIPVLTFIGDTGKTDTMTASTTQLNGEVVKLNSTKTTKFSTQTLNEAELIASKDPLERATTAAALINQLKQDGIEANTIAPVWESGNYVIKFGDRATLKFDDRLILPQTTRNKAQDVLEATNLLRRLLGGAAPVNQIKNAPAIAPLAAKPTAGNMLGQFTEIGSGLASWYGPGFEGNYTASGEVFDSSAMTAAHLTLPFGTHLRVTNLDNGKSVVVRITDRGPFTGDRVIDMSRGSAELIGLTLSGVAPVKLEILSPAILTGASSIR